MRKLVTIMMPTYNEEENIPKLFQRLSAVIATVPEYDFEFLVIDNCSEDDTEQKIRDILEIDKRWRYIRFSRNFGYEASLACSLNYAKGDALIFLASDLQEPPEMIPKMLTLWKEQKADVVYGVLNKRNDSTIFKSWGAKVAYRMIFKLSDITIPENSTDFRLISKKVIQAVKDCGERNRYIRGLIHWIGFKQVPFCYDRAPRLHGESGAGLVYCLNFAISALIAFSAKPLRFASMTGLFIMAFSLLAALLYIFIKIATSLGWQLTYFQTPAPGYVTMLLAILFFGGMQSFFLGIVGEYVARIYTETKHRPLWCIDKMEG